MINDNPLVSIIIPVYNAEKYIHKCLESILRQSYQNLEIVLVNDGSKDNSENIINEFSDYRIKLYNIENHGVSYARNYGIKSSSGDYLMFVDADDYISDNAVEFLVDSILKNNVDIVRFNGYVENEKNVFSQIEFNVENSIILNSPNDSEKLIDYLNVPGKSLRCYSPLLFMKNQNIILFNEDLTYLEDKVFYIQNFLNNKKILFVNQLLYYYTYNANSKTKDTAKFIENMRDILNSKKFVLDVALSNSYSKLDVIDASYGILILYRIDFMVKNVSFKKAKLTIKMLCNDPVILDALSFDSKYANKFKKFQQFLLKKNCYFIFVCVTKVKKLLKR